MFRMCLQADGLPDCFGDLRADYDNLHQNTAHSASGVKLRKHSERDDDESVHKAGRTSVRCCPESLRTPCSARAEQVDAERANGYALAWLGQTKHCCVCAGVARRCL